MMTHPANTGFFSRKPPPFRTRVFYTGECSTTLGDKATPFSRCERRPVALVTTLSPLEGPCFPSQILSRPVRLATWAARRCMAVTTDLGANELRWLMLSRKPIPDRMVVLLPPSQGAVRLRSARAFLPVPHSENSETGRQASPPPPSVPSLPALARDRKIDRNLFQRFFAEGDSVPWVNAESERADLVASQVVYGDEIEAWLRSNFGEFGAHPAAVIEVIRLHYVVGRGMLTVKDHGALIRAAVDRWNSRSEDADVSGAEESGVGSGESDQAGSSAFSERVEDDAA